MKKKYLTPELLLRIITVLLLAAMFFVLFKAMVNLTAAQSSAGRDSLEAAIRRSVMTCYAEEGVYPPSLDYLLDNYGMYFNDSDYIVHYDIFAENIMPDITVLEKAHE